MRDFSEGIIYRGCRYFWIKQKRGNRSDIIFYILKHLQRTISRIIL